MLKRGPGHSAYNDLSTFAADHLWARNAFARLTKPVRYGDRRVLRGPAKGLRINLQGSRPSYLLGLAETDVLEFLKQHVKPGATCYDLGANVGFITLFMARAAGSDGRVIAFEPAPQTAEALRHNARLNHFSQVEVVEAAVSNLAGEAAFDPKGISHQSGRLAEAGAVATITVPTVTIDELVAERLPPPDVIKMDIEGHEDQAIDGMRQTLMLHHPVILIEVHKAHHRDEHKVERVLRECGYAVSWLEPGMSRERQWWVPHVVGIPKGAHPASA